MRCRLGFHRWTFVAGGHRCCARCRGCAWKIENRTLTASATVHGSGDKTSREELAE